MTETRPTLLVVDDVVTNIDILLEQRLHHARCNRRRRCLGQRERSQA
jgi:hypothetical protein